MDHTVYIQIFEGCKFCRRPKSKISAAVCDFFMDLLLSYLVLQVYYDCFINFQDLNFVDDKLPVKTVKFTSLENLHVYGICDH